MIDPALLAAIAANKSAALSLIKRAQDLAPGERQQVEALMTAASVIIEREVGADMAPAALASICDEITSGWLASHVGQTRQ
ncbi:hypothetical protein BH10PSE12_BH10PSE12_01850 [soil metagenome]